MGQRQRFSVSDVSGGMNVDQDPLYIAENEAVDLLNFRIDRIGGLTGRQGQFQYGATAPGGALVLALGRWNGPDRLASSVALVALSDGTIRTVDPDDGSMSAPLYSGLSSSAQGHFMQAEDLVLYANGVDGVVVFDGTTAFDLFIAPPTSVTATAQSGGTLPGGTYRYAVSYVSTTLGWESGATESVALTSPESVVVSVAQSPHPMVDRIHVYRTLANGSTYLFLTFIVNSAAPSFTDDGSLTPSPTLAPTLDTVIPGQDVGGAPENLAYHKGRLWASVGDELYWSRPFQWNLFPFFTNARVPFVGNDRVTALQVFQDYLLVFGEMNTVLVAGGNTDFDIQLVRQDTDIGAPSRHAIVEVENQLVFLSARGLHVYPGFAEYAPRLTRTICNATAGCRADASLVYVPEERSLWLSITDQTWVVHLVNQGLSRYNFYMRKPLSGGVSGTDLPVWVNAEHARVAPTNATHLNQYGGLTDFGSAIDYLFISRIWTLDSPDFYKYWRRVGLFANAGELIRLTVRCPDTLRSHVVDLLAVDAGEFSLWGSDPSDFFGAVWDTSKWSTEGMLYYLSALPAHDLYGRTLQLELQGSSEIGLDIHSPITLQFRAADRFLGR